ncbi:MAG: hypothetical protein OXR64_06820 [Chloroflexota bacterium]|nr:hypothetical protein [Chloroflexota bacterium]MDE2919546.1 hypothetical protein [Chloroflexota bacterium]
MTHKIVVDERALLTIVDEMRIRIPEEIREARRVMRQRDQIPQSAQMEAERIVQQAQEQAEQMIRDEEIVKQAEAHALQMVQEAEERTDASREEMDFYALSMLRDLESRLESHLTSIRRGVAALDQSDAEPVEFDEEPA